MLRRVSQHSLRRCQVDFQDRTLDRASLFPVFDDAGRTRWILITAEESSRIMLIAWSPDLFARHWVRRNRLQRRFADLTDVSEAEAERLGDLWHFDPWWVLGEERYSGHSAVPALRRTNIPGYDDTLGRMWFEGNLGRVSFVATHSAESLRLRRFTPAVLPEAARERHDAAARAGSTERARAEWRLRPFWQ